MDKQKLLSNEIVNLLADRDKLEFIVDNPKQNKELLKNIHDYYEYICSKNIELDKTLMAKLSRLSEIYIYFFKTTKQKNVHPFSILKDELNKRITEMKTIDEIDSFYPYYRDIYITTNNSKLFSIDDQYKSFPGDNNIYEQNGVSVITPSQTISFVNSKQDGLYNYYHDDNFRRIFHSVYGQDFKYNYTGQDIKIRHINSSYKGSQARGMTIEIPIPINSSQKISLINLNNNIKSLIQSGINMTIEVALLKENGNEFYNCKCINLDELLDELLIDDSIEYRYKEQFLIGECNIDCSYILKKY